MRLGAIILAGGRSTRMGRPKESIELGGRTLLARACATMAGCASPVVVVARDAAQVLPELPPGVHRTHDAVVDRGPLVGIAAGLRWLAGAGGLAATDAAFAMACDQPFVTAAVVRALAAELGDGEVVMPKAGGFLQPLCAIYRLSVLTTVEELLAQGVATPRTLASLPRGHVLDQARLAAVDPSLDCLRSLDTPEDLAWARRRVADRTP
ncbi:MAG: molybdenum cofactor guanylyltransferase [Planctomycetota bacterium]